MKKFKEVLLIDDDHVSNFITEKLLMKLGITEKVTIKENGRAALDFIRQNCITDNTSYCPQFILFDYKMPVMDGLEFLKELNLLDLRKTIQIVPMLLAVQIPEPLLNEFIELGIEDYTLKPLDEEVVMNTYYKYWNKEGIWIGQPGLTKK